jgi:hypothetical protein
MNLTLFKNAAKGLGAMMVATAALALAGCATNDPVWQQNQRDLANLEACGYQPKAWDPYYPDDLQQAQRKYDAGQCGAKPK